MFEMTGAQLGLRPEPSGSVPMLQLRRLLGRCRRKASPPTRAVPPACAPLVEALLLGVDQVQAATAFVRARAELADALADCLKDVDYAFLAVTGTAAAHTVIRAAATAWGEVTQGHYNGIGCLDPLTGLASRQHFLTQLAGVYGHRLSSPPDVADRLGHALLVVDLATPPPTLSASFATIEESVRELLAAEEIRKAVPGVNTHARLRCCRSVALVGSGPDLDAVVDGLGTAIDLRLAAMSDWGPTSVRRVPLPACFAEARALVDQLGHRRVLDPVPRRSSADRE